MPFLLKKKIIFSDEAHFDLGGYVCRQTKLSHLGHRKPARITHPKRVTVLCDFWSRGIIGPFFFKNEHGEAVTANGDRYRVKLNEFSFIKIEEEDIGNIWFQQDGATSHTGESKLGVFRPVFEDRVINRRADFVRPSLSSDVTPLNYYL